MDGIYLNSLYAVFAMWTLLLGLAAAYDLWQFIIPNAISVILALLFFPSAYLLGIGIDWMSHLGAAVMVFAGGVAAYRFRILGAGDAKLLTAIALWVSVDGLLQFLLFVVLCGGGLAVSLIIVRRLTLSLMVLRASPEQVALPRILVTNEMVPYGVAIAAAAVIVGRDLPLFTLLP